HHSPRPPLLHFPPFPPPPTTLPLQHFAAVLPSRAELHPSTVRCCSPLARRRQPFNSSLLFSPHALKSAFNTSLPFSPHAPNSNLQQFAAVLPSRTEVRLQNFPAVFPSTREIQPSTIP